MIKAILQRLRRKRGETPVETGEENAEAPYGTLAGVPMSEEESAMLTMGQMLFAPYRKMLNAMLCDLNITEGETHCMGNNLYDCWTGEDTRQFKGYFYAGDLSKIREVQEN